MAQAPPTTTLPRKVWTVTKTGSLAGLRLDDDVIAAPGPGEVRITVKAVGLNFADVFSVLGKYFPFTVPLSANLLPIRD
jgi:NADPH:quinone reductase-like Zn-dependent oxidoreductase|tara:strand:+ start:1319 stop:1555 length:237 start_codon:yes stop_codon:yes gene_type:complete